MWDRAGTRLWLESVFSAAEAFSRSATSANAEIFSTQKVVHGRRPSLPLLPFFQLSYHRFPQQRRTDPRARTCFFLNFGYNHGRDCYRVMDAMAGMMVHYRGVTSHQPREPLILPARTSAVGTANPAPTPEYVIRPPPTYCRACTYACSRACVNRCRVPTCN